MDVCFSLDLWGFLSNEKTIVERIEMAGSILVIYALSVFLRGSSERELAIEIAACRDDSLGDTLPGRDESPE